MQCDLCKDFYVCQCQSVLIVNSQRQKLCPLKSIKHKFWDTWTKLDRVFREESPKNLENEEGWMGIGLAEGSVGEETGRALKDK